MWSIVVTVNLAVNGTSFPMETVPPLELEREPHVHKTPIGEKNTQFIEIRDNDLGDDIGELDLSDLSQPLDTYQTHATTSRSCKRLSRSYSRWSRRSAGHAMNPPLPASLHDSGLPFPQRSIPHGGR
jgi:hypothetical protein